MGGFERGAPASAPRAGLARERALALLASAASARSASVHTVRAVYHCNVIHEAAR